MSITTPNEAICNIVHGPIPKIMFVRINDKKATTKPSITSRFNTMIISNAVIGCIFGKAGIAKTILPTVIAAVINASSAILLTVKCCSPLEVKRL